MSLSASFDLAEEERRARQLEAAKKKSFRATRTSGPATSSHTRNASASSSKSSLPSRSPRLPSTVLPLMTETGGNIAPSHARTNSKGKGKAAVMDIEVERASGSLGAGGWNMGHERVRSGAKASGRHRRQVSSISAPPAHSLQLPRAPQTDSEETERSAEERMGGFRFNLPVPREISLTPATPLVSTNDLNDPFTEAYSPVEEDPNEVKQRLSAFSFGSKPPPASPSRSPVASPVRRQRLGSNPSLLPSLALRAHDLNFPPSPFGADPTTSMSAPAGLDKLAHGTPSRPPSLLFTNATPLNPSPSAPSRLSAALASDPSSPSTPPTPARKRHSHSRSTSISLSGLKLGIRPTSLGISTSPSFPSSPRSSGSLSPDEARLPARSPVSGTRLKFEPSEAEMAKEESRRKALEKLNGASPLSSPLPVDEPQAEISLPDLDDDTSSTSSSIRPSSGAWSFGGRPNSLSPTPRTDTPAMGSGLFPAWTADEGVNMSFDRWSAGFKEDNLGFGSGGLDSLPKRGSFQGTLPILPEIEETEEEEEEETEEDVKEEEGLPVEAHERYTFVDLPSTADISHATPTVQPTPSRLRELHLVSSGPGGTPIRPTSSSDSASSGPRSLTRPAPISPTKGYGMIGRGRPRPLSGIGTKSSFSTSHSGSSASPLTANVVTPRTARLSGARRRLSGSERRSSISYKKEKDSVENTSISSSLSSRWSINSRNVVSPPPSADPSSPPPLPSPRGTANWAHIPRGRTCPRPKSLVGLGLQSAGGSNRVLSEVLERDEGDALGLGDGWQSAPPVTDRPFTFRSFGSLEMSPEVAGRASLESEDASRWRDGMLELEMERDALREDVDGWRERCRGLEDKLEEEKRESSVLRDRVRKLGDRLLTLSTVPTQAPARESGSSIQESRVVSEMRDQLFNLTSTVERERRDKEAALQRVAELETRLNDPPPQPEPTWSFAPFQSPPRSFGAQQRTSPSPSRLDAATSSFNSPWPSTPIITPATPAMTTPGDSDPFAPSRLASEMPTPADSPQTDANAFRMRAWGFPSAPSPGMPTSKQSKRESFFGLSKVPQSTDMEVETEMYDGIDLPPITPALVRAVSDPVPTFDAAQSGALRKSTSASSFSNSAFSLISTYLPTRSSPTKSRSSPTKSSLDTDEQEVLASDDYSQADLANGIGLRKAAPDMRFSCRCCVGDVLEL